MHQHLQRSEQGPSIRDELFNQLEATIDKNPKIGLVFIAGDFNAKVQNDIQRKVNLLDSMGKVKETAHERYWLIFA